MNKNRSTNNLATTTETDTTMTIDTHHKEITMNTINTPLNDRPFTSDEVSLMSARVDATGIIDKIFFWRHSDGCDLTHAELVTDRAMIIGMLLLIGNWNRITVKGLADLFQYRLSNESKSMLGLPEADHTSETHPVVDRNIRNSTRRACGHLNSVLRAASPPAAASGSVDNAELSEENIGELEKVARARLDEFKRGFLTITSNEQFAEAGRSTLNGNLPEDLPVIVNRSYAGGPGSHSRLSDARPLSSNWMAPTRSAGWYAIRPRTMERVLAEVSALAWFRTPRVEHDRSSPQFAADATFVPFKARVTLARTGAAYRESLRDRAGHAANTGCDLSLAPDVFGGFGSAQKVVPTLQRGRSGWYAAADEARPERITGFCSVQSQSSGKAQVTSTMQLTIVNLAAITADSKPKLRNQR